MPEPRDPLESWLGGDVPPLPPPPGTLARIRKRARRRKLTQAAVSAAGAAAVIAFAATVPQYAIAQFRSDSATPRHHGAASRVSPTVPVPGHAAQPSGAVSGTPSQVPTRPPVPASFAPASVTFVSTATGWALGQAGTPGSCGPPSPGICTSIARTDDGGQSWYGVPAPVAGQPDGAAGVSQVRFSDASDGWVFGPQLWATHDGGRTWTRIPTHGRRVIALAARDGTAYAVQARCSGTGAAFAAGCTSYALYSAAAASNAWQRVPVQGQDLSGSPGGSLPLVLGAAGGYLLTPSGGLLTGPVSGTGPWHPAGGALSAGVPCTPAASGQQGGPLLTGTGRRGLAAVCAVSGLTGGPRQTVYYSGDSGNSWRLAGSARGLGRPASLAGTPSGSLVLATGHGISVSADHGASWRAARVASPPPGGFSYVGMTTSRQGVAIPAAAAEHAIWFSYDGGRRWAPVSVSP